MGIVNEELFWGDAGIALAIFGTGLGVAGILGNGTPEQIMTWVPQCFGTPEDVKLAAFCVTEPDAGSDVSSLRTRAKKDGSDWVLNGTKCFITNGGIADVHVVVATVDPSLGARGQASFVVPPGTPGLSMGKKERKMGIRASHTAEVIFDDVRIPSECLLGGEEKLEARLARAREGGRTSTQAAMRTFEASRPIVGIQAVGIARAAYEYALEYAKERTQFGKPIIENQAIAFLLADMATEIDAARLLVLPGAVDGPQRRRLQDGRRLDEQAQGRPHRRVGHRAGHPDPRRLRLHPRLPRRALAPRRQDLRPLRRHRADPAAGDQPGDLRRAHSLIHRHRRTLKVRLTSAPGRSEFLRSLRAGG